MAFVVFNNFGKFFVLFLFLGFLLGLGFSTNPKSCDVYDGEDTILPAEGCEFVFNLKNFNNVNDHLYYSWMSIDYDFKINNNIIANIEIFNNVWGNEDVHFEIDLTENGSKYPDVSDTYLNLDISDKSTFNFKGKPYLIFEVTLPQTSENIAIVVVKPTQNIIEDTSTNVPLCGKEITLKPKESCVVPKDTDYPEIILISKVGLYNQIQLKKELLSNNVEWYYYSYFGAKKLELVEIKMYGDKGSYCTIGYNIINVMFVGPNMVITAINPVANKDCSFGKTEAKEITTTSCKFVNSGCTDWNPFNNSNPYLIGYSADLVNDTIKIMDTLSDTNSYTFNLHLNDMLFCNIARPNKAPLQRYFKQDVDGLKVCKTQGQIEQAQKEKEEQQLGCETANSIPTTKFSCKDNTDEFRTWKLNTLTVDVDNNPETKNITSNLLGTQKLKCNIDYGLGVKTEYYQIKSDKLQVCTKKSASSTTPKAKPKKNVKPSPTLKDKAKKFQGIY